MSLDDKVRKVAYDQSKCNKLAISGGKLYFCREKDKAKNCLYAINVNFRDYCYPVKGEMNHGRKER